MDYRNRAQREARLARLISQLGMRQQRVLIEALGDPPALENLPPEFWTTRHAELESVLTPEIESILLDSAAEFIRHNPAIGVNWGTINERALNWARRYGYDLVSDIEDTSREILRQSIADFYEQRLALGQLRERLMSLYGPVRADMIATTETTRAATQGELEVIRELEAQGIRMIPIWQTNVDEFVCPECGDRHNRQIIDGIYPPKHPRCRCWVAHEFERS